MHNVIISAPWGNYYKLLHFKGVTYTLGTYTLNERGRYVSPKGGRFTRVALTVRYSIALKGWKNKIGLKNPGIKWLCDEVLEGWIDASDKIVSIYGWSDSEWSQLLDYVSTINPLAVEINCGCPNVDKPPFTKEVFEMAVASGIRPIVKIPPVFYHKIVKMAMDAGVRSFHACNTLPTEVGGISGKPLLQISRGVVSSLRDEYGSDIIIIGGGGITNWHDAQSYIQAGANHVALGSMLFAPWNWLKVKGIEKAVQAKVWNINANA